MVSVDAEALGSSTAVGGVVCFASVSHSSHTSPLTAVLWGVCSLTRSRTNLSEGCASDLNQERQMTL
jgi:hypothetical protein